LIANRERSGRQRGGKNSKDGLRKPKGRKKECCEGEGHDARSRKRKRGKGAPKERRGSLWLYVRDKEVRQQPKRKMLGRGRQKEYEQTIVQKGPSETLDDIVAGKTSAPDPTWQEKQKK